MALPSGEKGIDTIVSSSLSLGKYEPNIFESF